MKYFAKKTSVYTAKNKLQEAALSYFKSAEIEHRIIDADDLQEFLNTHIKAIEALNKRFSRCKPIECSSFQNHSSDYILRIPELIFFSFYAEKEYNSASIKILSCPKNAANEVCTTIKKTIFIDGISKNSKAIYQEICSKMCAGQETKSVIIDGIADITILREIISIFNGNAFMVKNEYRSFPLPMPNLIITTNLDCRFLSTEELKRCEILEVDKEKEVKDGK
jgi:hypothetical protein